MTAALKQHTTPDFNEPAVTAELGAQFGLSAEEYEKVLAILDRTPTYTELGIFSVMWSEHCSYKSSRHFLAQLPTKADWVIQGPGENAGVIDIGDNQAAIFKMESHNHPSYIEPYQGAATGVGGILRDVFTMGARPIANVNALRFGSPDHKKTRHLISGVVKGIGDYGNCMGIPTVAGEVDFHDSYNGNILVNAMTVGIAEHDKIFYSRGASPEQPVVYVGSKTGRDGIHGATMASAEFDDEAEAQRPTVQVGDPFTEKLLLEACLELMQSDSIVAIQDMGAAGLTSSSVEIADKGGIGVELDLDQCPQREMAMMPYELMLSESQERMLIILKPGREDEAKAIFDKWDLDFAVIGKTTDDKRLRLNMYGKQWCDIPVPPLVDEAPKYIRPHSDPKKPDPIDNEAFPLHTNYADTLKKLISCPDMASKRWVWEQYDPLVRGDTIAGPAQAAAALVRVDGTNKALAISSDCTPRYVFADPYEGGKQAVAESWRNVTATGATPLAVTNNLNFGNPEKPEIMGQFVKALEGMGDACRALDYPIVSGNVSLYNETNGKAIFPTPVIGGVGVLKDIETRTTIEPTHQEMVLILVGGAPSHIGQSLYLREVHGKEAGQAPAVDLDHEKKIGDFVRQNILSQAIDACQDVSDGGSLCAVADMAMAARYNGMGIDLADSAASDKPSFWFGEDQGRYVVAVKHEDSFLHDAKQAGVAAQIIGHMVDEEVLILPDGERMPLNTLVDAHEDWMPNYMAGDK